VVDVNKIHNLFNKHFETTGDVSIDPASGTVNVTGDVNLKSILSQLPVSFGTVKGLFDCSHNRITHLRGAPSYVGGDFFCQWNLITHLQGAPSYVGGIFDCHRNKLTSLQEAPLHVGGWFHCTYDDQLPLLRLILFHSIDIYHAPKAVHDIMQKYVGKGKAHMLNLALELKKAGFAGNAAW
jgi:hypothetical protein